MHLFYLNATKHFKIMKKRIAYTLAFAHLLLIALVITHVLDYPIKRGNWQRSAAFLSSINYSIWQYGFFSPDVGKSTELEITLEQEDSTILHFSTLDSFRFNVSNNESLNRFYGFKVRAASDTLYGDLCSRSVATRLFNNYPNTRAVGYAMRSVRYPSMSGFLAKDSILKIEFYNTEYRLY